MVHKPDSISTRSTANTSKHLSTFAATTRKRKKGKAEKGHEGERKDFLCASEMKREEEEGSTTEETENSDMEDT